VKRAQRRRERAPDDLRPSDDRPPERVIAEHRLAEHVEDAILRVVLVHRDLLEHDLALVGEVVAVQPRPPDHVGDDVERLG
jgi:hypothetical protein